MTDKNIPAGFDAFDEAPTAKRIKRHAKELQAKAKVHKVLPVDPEHKVFTVISGGSGKQYRVIMFDDFTGNCNCDWGTKRPTALSDNKGAVGCSHVLAVIGHMAQAEGKRVSSWADVDEAKRQHAKTISAADGLVVTQRAGTKSQHRVQLDFFGLVDGC